jgi:hypothetical protein
MLKAGRSSIGRLRFRSGDMYALGYPSRQVNSPQKTKVYPYFVGSKHQVLRLNAAGISSVVSDDGRLPVECVRLDGVLVAERPTFLKMDIEGF